MSFSRSSLLAALFLGALLALSFAFIEIFGQPAPAVGSAVDMNAALPTFVGVIIAGSVWLWAWYRDVKEPAWRTRALALLAELSIVGGAAAIAVTTSPLG